MLRFHKFTIGWTWTAEYGSPEKPEEFKAMGAYSPLHNLKPRTAYPTNNQPQYGSDQHPDRNPASAPIYRVSPPTNYP